MPSFVARVRDRVTAATGIHVTTRRAVSVYAGQSRQVEWDRLTQLVRQFVPAQDPVVIDVGAHRGESVAFYRGLFPRAYIVSVEPDPTLAGELRALDVADHVAEVALSDREGEQVLHRSRQTVMSSLESFSPALAEAHGDTEVTVSLQRGDDLVRELAIKQIGVLKINVQGHEDKVLAGFSETLARKAIDFVYVEINCGTRYQRYVSMGDVEQHLTPHGYWLVEFPLIKLGGPDRVVQMLHCAYVRNGLLADWRPQ